MPRKPDIAPDEHAAKGPRIWPARAGLAAWFAFLLAMCVLDASWAPFALVSATLVLALVSIVLGVFSGARMQARIEVPEAAAKAQPARCTLVVENTSALPVWRVDVPVSIANPLTGERFGIVARAALLPHGVARVPLEVTSPYCGCLSLSVDAAFTRDICAVVRRRRALEAEAHIVVHPLAAEIALEKSGASAHDIESFTYAPDRKGDDPAETYTVREYEPGDSVRRIHWKLSTKLGATMLRESSFPIYSTLLFVLETGFAAGELDPAKADAHMEAAVALMQALLSAGIAFDLAYMDRAAGHVGIKRISDTPLLWDSVSGLLLAPREETDESCVRALLEVSGATVWARVAYMACGSIGADAADLVAGGGKLSVLRCVDTGVGTHEDPAFTELRFTPQGWATELAGVEL